VLIPAGAYAQDTGQRTDVAPSDTSRLFIGPTGRMLAPGQGYVSWDGVFTVTGQVGVTPFFSMGAGTMVPVGGGRFPVWITPKVQIYNGDRAAVAAGLVSVFVPGVAGTGGLAYTVGTFGTLGASATVGGGVFYVGGPEGGEMTPVAMVGGERRFKPRVSFLTENYLGVHSGLVSGGVRWRLQDWQVSLAAMLPFGRGWAFPGIWVSVAHKFGGRSR
jgi:hypothetical protein